MRKFFTRLHRWLSLPFGLFISIMCFTGALLLWKSELAALCGTDANESSFFRGVTQLHRWLFMVPANPHGGLSVGRVIMGGSAIACTLIIVSGIVMWWPRNRQQLTNRLKVHLSLGWRRFVHDSHVSLGIYAAVFLLLMSLTGPVWSFGWYRKAAVAVIGGKEMPRNPRQDGEGPSAQRPTGWSDSPANHGGNHWDKYRGPAGERRLGQRPAGDEQRGESQEIGHGAERRESDKGGQDKNSPQRTFVSLHMGKWGGIVTKIIYTLATLIGGFLPISGYYLWWKHRQHPRHT